MKTIDHSTWGYKYDSLKMMPTAQCVCGKMTEAHDASDASLRVAHSWHLVDVERQVMYEDYKQTCRAQTPRAEMMSFDEWMVSRGFGYSTVDKRWVLV